MTPEDFLIAEHRRISEQLAVVDQSIENPSTELATRFSEFQQLVQKHFRHEDPYYRRVDDGKRIADRGLMHTLRNDHAAVLFTLESLKIRLRKTGITEEWRERYQALRRVLLGHLETEEHSLFEKAPATLTDLERAALLKEMQDLEP